MLYHIAMKCWFYELPYRYILGCSSFNNYPNLNCSTLSRVSISHPLTVKVILHSLDTAIVGYEIFSGYIFNEKTWHYAQNWNSAWNKETPHNVINSNIFYSLFQNFQTAEEKIALRRIRLLSCITEAFLISSINSISCDCRYIAIAVHAAQPNCYIVFLYCTCRIRNRRKFAYTKNV